MKVPDAVQNRSELKPVPCVPIEPVKRCPSWAVTVNEPEQPPQFSEFPVWTLRNPDVPETRQWPVSTGMLCPTTGPAAVTGAGLVGDGPVALTLLHAQLSNVA